jgi:phosphohistidine phosphatase SixA
VRALELRRHAPRDPQEDRLSKDGQALALHIGKNLPGGYVAVFTSPAKRAAETAAYFMRALGQQLPQIHGVSDDLASDDPQRLARGVNQIFEAIPDGGRGLAVGHTPLLETAVKALTGETIEPLKECEGVLLEEEDGTVRLATEYRREDV